MTMRHVCSAVLALVGGLAAAGPASASLIGASVTGSLQFDFGSGFAASANYYDPANGLVAPLALNNAGTTVTIASPAGEFGFFTPGGVFSINANFTASELSISEGFTGSGTTLPQHFKFTSAAFTGRTLSEAIDTFTNGGMNASLTGDTLTIDWLGGSPAFSAVVVYDFSDPVAGPSGGGGAAVPLPAALIPGLLMGGAVVARVGRKRRSEFRL